MEMRNPNDGTTYNIGQEAFDQWFSLNNDCQKDDVYEKWVNRLEDVSETVRNFFKKLIPLATKVGKVIIQIGKIILNILMKIVTHFPNTITGFLVGLGLGLIISEIPLIGWLLGPILPPLLASAGAIAGFMADMSKMIADAGVEAKIRSRVREDFERAGFTFKA
jgi:uncharacterized membrane protein